MSPSEDSSGQRFEEITSQRLRWFRQVQRRESEYIGRRMMKLELPGGRQG